MILLSISGGPTARAAAAAATDSLPTFLLSPCCVLVVGQVAAMTLDTQNAVMPPPSGVNHP